VSLCKFNGRCPAQEHARNGGAAQWAVDQSLRWRMNRRAKAMRQIARVKEPQPRSMQTCVACKLHEGIIGKRRDWQSANSYIFLLGQFFLLAGGP
jgi:hypothetical protein